MKLKFHKGLYFLKADRQTYNENAFRYHRTFKNWYTEDPEVAMRFIDYSVDDETHFAIEADWANRHLRIMKSKASEVCGKGWRKENVEGAYDYQNAGIDYVLSNFRCQRYSALIADDMGLGKTLQAIGVMNQYPGWGRILIICPAVVKYHWASEIKRWGTVDHQVHIISGSKSDKFDEPGIFIINYDIVKNFVDELYESPWDYMVIDEGQYLKNPKALRTCVVCGGWYTSNKK